jgi:hypothetical protein
MALRELFIKISLNSGDTKKQVEGINKEVDRAKDEFEKFGKSGLSAYQKLATGIATLGLGSIVTNFAKASLQTFGKFEKYETVLRTTFTNSTDAMKEGMDVVSYSTKRATESMGLINDFASRTPYSVDELTGSFIKLANRGLVPTIETLTSFGDVAASQGKSFDQFTEALLDAVGGEFERMKEFGIKASKSGDQVSLAFKNMTTTVKNTPEEIQKAIIALGKMEGVTGGMNEIAKTFEGRLSNLGDTIDSIKVKTGKLLNVALGPLLEFFTDNEKGAKRTELAFNILAITIGVGLVMAAKSAMIAGYEMMIPYLPIIGIVGAIVLQLTAMYLVLDDILTFFESGPDSSDTYFADILRWLGLTDDDLKGLFNQFQDLKKILMELWESLKLVFQNETFVKIVKWIFILIGAIIFFKIILITSIIVGLIYLLSKWNQIWETIKEKFNGFKNWLLETWNFIVNSILSLPGKVVSMFISFKNQLHGIFSGLWLTLKSTFQNILPTDAINSIIDGINWMILKLNDWTSGKIASSLGISPLNLKIIPKLEKRELGGPVNAFQPYIVGEKGPEVIVPKENGTVIPNNKINQSVSSGNNIFHFNITMKSVSQDYDARAMFDKFMEIVNSQNYKSQQRFEMGI